MCTKVEEVNKVFHQDPWGEILILMFQFCWWFLNILLKMKQVNPVFWNGWFGWEVDHADIKWTKPESDWGSQAYYWLHNRTQGNFFLGTFSLLSVLYRESIIVKELRGTFEKNRQLIPRCY